MRIAHPLAAAELILIGAAAAEKAFLQRYETFAAPQNVSAGGSKRCPLSPLPVRSGRDGKRPEKLLLAASQVFCPLVTGLWRGRSRWRRCVHERLNGWWRWVHRRLRGCVDVVVCTHRYLNGWRRCRRRWRWRYATAACRWCKKNYNYNYQWPPRLTIIR